MCGDGKYYGVGIECDDGNLLNGDGCDSTCNIESGYACTHIIGSKDVCYEPCGDGINLLLGYV